MVVLSRGTTSDNRLSVWRLNTVTGETRRLSSGKGDQDSGSCTPDGKWVVYHGLQESDGFLHIFKVSIDGGQPVELAHGNVGSLSVSPDGRFVAYTQVEGQSPSSKLKFVVQKAEGGAPVQELDAPFNIDVVGWTPDGPQSFLCPAGWEFQQSLYTAPGWRTAHPIEPTWMPNRPTSSRMPGRAMARKSRLFAHG